MSSLPEMTGGVDLSNLKDGWFELNLEQNDYCLYGDFCGIDKNTSGRLCIYCIYRKQLDIPKMIKFIVVYLYFVLTC